MPRFRTASRCVRNRSQKGPEPPVGCPTLMSSTVENNPAYCTPLSFGLANASLIGAVSGKFMLTFLGGIGLVNHLA